MVIWTVEVRSGPVREGERQCLGVHTSRKRAEAHMNTIITDRLTHLGMVQAWNLAWIPYHSGDAVRKAYLYKESPKPYSTCEVSLCRWGSSGRHGSSN